MEVYEYEYNEFFKNILQKNSLLSYYNWKEIILYHLLVHSNKCVSFDISTVVLEMVINSSSSQLCNFV